jgi:hypothetical protein
MNSKSMLRLALVAGLVHGANAGAVDRALYDQYQGYKQRQQRGQQEVLEQARAAARNWDFAEAEKQLATARNMAYTPDDLRAVEQLIADNRAAKAAKEEGERVAAERARQEAEAQRQREAQQAQVAAQQAAEAAQRQRAAASSGGGNSASRCVTVTATMVCGLGDPWCQTRRLCVSGGPGIVDAGYGSDHGCSTSHVFVCTGYGGALAGTYSWSAQFGEGQDLQVCSGTVEISGASRELAIKVYNKCDDAGTHEW